MIDEIDEQLLALLQQDARLSHSALAEQIDVPVSTVHNRVKRLEQRGIITGYQARVNASALGKPIMAFIRLSITGRGYIENKHNITKLCQIEAEVLEAYGVAGEDCYLLKVRTANPESLEKLLERIRSKAGVNRSITSIVLSTIKEGGLIVPAVEALKK